jgi:L-threonylcarbamoyladenylate synthase
MMAGSNPLGHGRIAKADSAAIAEAVERLRAGDIVAIPTETVYGLAADAFNAEAVANIYRTKGRPDFNPLIVHVPDHAAAEQLAQFDERAAMLAFRFWPGAVDTGAAVATRCAGGKSRNGRFADNCAPLPRPSGDAGGA